MKKVRLEDISPENFKPCVELKVAADQNGFVATNVMSIAQSKIYPTMRPMAVVADDEIVGFVLFGLDEDDGRYYLVRLMIGEQFQGRGLGRAAVFEVIENLRENADCRELFLSFVPENTIAAKLYESIGFEMTGEVSNGENVMKFDMNKAPAN